MQKRLVVINGFINRIYFTNILIYFCLKIKAGDSIASEGKGEYMWCEGRIVDIDGNPVPNCKIETWETDDEGK